MKSVCSSFFKEKTGKNEIGSNATYGVRSIMGNAASLIRCELAKCLGGNLRIMLCPKSAFRYPGSVKQTD